MSSLVNTPMFEQEARKWHISEPCSAGTYVWAMMCIKLSLVPVIRASSLQVICNEACKPDRIPMFEQCIMATSSLWHPLIFRRTRTLWEIILFWTGILSRILRASKLCERQISLEPEVESESAQTATFTEPCSCSPRVLRRLEESAWDSPYLTEI